MIHVSLENMHLSSNSYELNKTFSLNFQDGAIFPDSWEEDESDLYDS